MNRSSYLLSICIGFIVGIFLNNFTIINWQEIFLLAILIIALQIIYWNNLFARIVLIAFLSTLLGIIYPYLIGRDRIIDGKFLSGLITWLSSVREIYSDALSRILPEPQASLASGLVVGIKSGFPANLKSAFIDTGTIHLVAVSGFNITVVLKIFSEWFKYFGRLAAFITGTVAIVLFITLVGGQASVVRAGIMGWLFLVAKYNHRLPNIRNALFFTATLMIAQEPKILIEDIGFQLSFISMLGMIYISPIFKDLSSRKDFTKRFPKFILSAVIETISAQIAVSLLILGHFGRISVIALLPNALIVPMIPFPMIGGIFLGFVSLVDIPFSQYFAIPLDLSLRYILKVIDIFNRVPFASYDFDKLNWYLVGLGYLVLILIITQYYRIYFDKQEK